MPVFNDNSRETHVFANKLFFEKICLMQPIRFLFIFKNLCKLCLNRVPNGVTVGGRLTFVPTTNIPSSSGNHIDPSNRDPVPLTATRTGPEPSRHPFLVTNECTPANRGGRDEKICLRASVLREHVYIGVL